LVLNERRMNNAEWVVPKEFGPEEKELWELSKIWGQVNAFGTDEQDEFQVIRQDGCIQGIFKTWAVPVIPFQTTGQLETLANLIPQIRILTQNGVTFEQSLDLLQKNNRNAVWAKEVLESWHQDSIDNPLGFVQQLERARFKSWLIDKRLTKIFLQEELSENAAERIEQLVNRLTLSIALLSPFYNLEALAGDAKGFLWNPVNTAQEEAEMSDLGGTIDSKALLLPSAFREFVKSESLEWNGLDWNELKKFSDLILSKPSRQRKELLRLIKELGVSPERVLFAINALQWIPVRVAGKKDDLPKTSALDSLETVSATSCGQESSVLVAGTGRLNALIRFFNWLPIIEGPDNFEGKNWTYASLCDTSAQLRDLLVKNPQVWEEEFGEIFESVILPQIKNLDAESAKARLLLKLILDEKRLRAKFQPGEDIGWKKNIIAKLVEKQKKEWIHQVGSGLQPIGMLGGKAFGLEFLHTAKSELNIPPGFVLTTEFVESLLKSDEELWKMIVGLNTEKDADKREELADNIRLKICNLEFGEEISNKINKSIEGLGLGDDQLLAVRSSSIDEDNPHLKEITGAGIQRSVLNVDRNEVMGAVKKCIASFFRPNALHFRQMKGLLDLPQFAVLIQPMVRGVGGIAFSKDLHGDQKRVISAAKRASAIADGSNDFAEFIMGERGVANISGDPTIISFDDLQKVDSVLKKIEGLTLERIDCEWVIDSFGKVWVLQARALPSNIELREERKIERDIVLDQEKQISDLEFLLSDNGGIRLTIIRDRNLDAFQGELFRLLIGNKDKLVEICLEKQIPLTCHFANICAGLGIKLSFLN